MAKAGLNLIKGLWQGISDAAGWIWGKIKGFFGGIVDGIKNFFGIHSPSTLLRDEIGKMLPPGISIGFEKAMPAAIDDIQGQLDVMVGKMQSGVAAEQSGISVQAASQNVLKDATIAQSPGVESKGVMYQQTVNNYSPKALSPAETARQTRNATRQLILAARRK